MIWVKNNGRGKLNLVNGVSLVPGVNAVPGNAWDVCRNNQMTKHFLGIGQIQVVSGPVEGHGRHPPSGPGPDAPVAPTASEEPETKPDLSPVMPDEDDDDDTDPMGDVIDDSGNVRMKAKDMIAMVAGMQELQPLKQLLLTETRSTVRAAIDKRLEELRSR